MTRAGFFKSILGAIGLAALPKQPGLKVINWSPEFENNLEKYIKQANENLRAVAPMKLDFTGKTIVKGALINTEFRVMGVGR